MVMNGGKYEGPQSLISFERDDDIIIEAAYLGCRFGGLINDTTPSYYLSPE